MNEIDNQSPELLLNHTWKIGVSRELGNQIDASRVTQLRNGDRFKIVRQDDSNDIRLFVWTSDVHDPATPDYDFEGVLKEYEPMTGGLYRKVLLEFIDTAGGDTKNKILTITAARLRAGYNDSKHECSSCLEDKAKFLNSAHEREQECSNDDLIIWKIEDVVRHRGPPESGQGTASGNIN